MLCERSWDPAADRLLWTVPELECDPVVVEEDKADVVATPVVSCRKHGAFVAPSHLTLSSV